MDATRAVEQVIQKSRESGESGEVNTGQSSVEQMENRHEDIREPETPRTDTRGDGRIVYNT